MESLDQLLRLEVREKVKNVFVMSLGLPDHQVLLHQAFFRFRSDFLAFFGRISYFQTFGI